MAFFLRRSNLYFVTIKTPKTYIFPQIIALEEKNGNDTLKLSDSTYVLDLILQEREKWRAKGGLPPPVPTSPPAAGT